MHRMNKTTKNWSKIRQKNKMKNRKKFKIKMLKELLSSKKMKKLKTESDTTISVVVDLRWLKFVRWLSYLFATHNFSKFSELSRQRVFCFMVHQEPVKLS